MERATVRPVVETSTTLSEQSSTSSSIRFNSRAGFSVGDYVMVGSEIIRIRNIPDSPDADIGFDNFNGQRIAYFDTSTEAHAIDSRSTKWRSIRPEQSSRRTGYLRCASTIKTTTADPGTARIRWFTSPLRPTAIIWSTSKIFEARAARIRLSHHHARTAPDFRLSVSPRNPNVPSGGSIPVELPHFEWTVSMVPFASR